MRNLSRNALLPASFLAACVLSTQAFAQEVDLAGKDVQWAWTSQEVSQAGTGFWPQYRGPKGDGVAHESCDPAIQWSESKNIAWRTNLPGKAWSSPVVWGEKIWLTNATGDGLSMSVLAIDRNTGKVLVDRVIFSNQETQKDYHQFNSYGSPTAVCDSQRVYITFGAYGTAALNALDGSLIWERRDLACNHYRGAGASPILYGNLLIFGMDGFDFQYIIALDKNTGKTLWKKDRTIEYGTDDGDWKKAYSTAHVIDVDGKQQIVSPAAKAVIAYEPATGQELWKVRYDEHSSAIRPLFDGKHLYISSGFSKAKLLSISPVGSGDITSSNVLWQATRAIGCKPSPVFLGGKICSLEDRGVLTAMDPTNGEIVWQKRLGGDFSSSPVVAKDRIYCFDEQGKGHVVNAQGEVLAENTLDAGCLASPAIVGNDLIVRTRTSLYCIRTSE
jgi:outer membrane protein assembly factor BamB